MRIGPATPPEQEVRGSNPLGRTSFPTISSSSPAGVRAIDSQNPLASRSADPRRLTEHKWLRYFRADVGDDWTLQASPSSACPTVTATTAPIRAKLPKQCNATKKKRYPLTGGPKQYSLPGHGLAAARAGVPGPTKPGRVFSHADWGYHGSGRTRSVRRDDRRGPGSGKGSRCPVRIPGLQAARQAPVLLDRPHRSRRTGGLTFSR